MNWRDVQLVGVFDPEGVDETFVYTVNAPVNLWIGALCSDGSRMGPQFMGGILNALLEADSFNEGDTYEVRSQSGALLTATVGHWVPSRTVEANAANSDVVRVITVAVGG